jgi:ferrochelatase
MKKHLPDRKINLIPSYATHPLFIEAHAQIIEQFFQENHLSFEDTLVLCSCHSLPVSYIEKGDPYEKECLASFKALQRRLPHLEMILSFQSQFDRSKWLTPTTESLSTKNYTKKVAILPLSFTSDHIETLFEIEYLYLPNFRKSTPAFRIPALNLSPHWITAAKAIISDHVVQGS